MSKIIQLQPVPNAIHRKLKALSDEGMSLSECLVRHPRLAPHATELWLCASVTGEMEVL